MTLTVKDFAKTLKISDKALIERMQKAGLEHSKSSDEVTASDKQALLKSLKGSKSSSKSVTSESGVKVTSKEKLLLLNLQIKAIQIISKQKERKLPSNLKNNRLKEKSNSKQQNRIKSKKRNK